MEFVFHPPHIVEAKAKINTIPTISKPVSLIAILTYPFMIYLLMMLLIKTLLIYHSNRISVLPPSLGMSRDSDEEYLFLPL